MRTLSFREQAAIAFATTVVYETSVFGGVPRAETTGIERTLLDERDAVGRAERLAEACCEAWGHSYRHDEEHQGSCTRCGCVPPRAEGWPEP